MTYNRVIHSWILVLFCLLSMKGLGQYKAPLDSSITAKLIAQSSAHQADDYYNPDSPLGRKAQLIRRDSYDSLSGEATQRGLWIKSGDSILLQYADMKLYDNIISEGNEVSPDDYGKAVDKTYKMLNRLFKKSAYARRIIETLQHSENKFTISLVDCIDSYMLVPIPGGRLGVLNNNAYAFQVLDQNKQVVDYAPFDRVGSSAEIRWGPQHKIIRLAHELSHAYDANFGLMDDRLMELSGEVVLAREVRALYHENMIRKELNKQIRTELKGGIKTMVFKGTPYTYPLPVIARH